MSPDPTSLDRMHDVIASPPIPWWLPAPGWYVLGGLLLFLALIVGLRVVARWQANRYRREALHELDQHRAQAKEPAQRGEILITMAALLKRAAVTAFPRERVASLSGPNWLSFLDRTGQTKAFSEGPGQWLEKVSYDPRCATSIAEEDVRTVETMVRHWLRHHRVDLDQKDPA